MKRAQGLLTKIIITETYKRRGIPDRGLHKGFEWWNQNRQEKFGQLLKGNPAGNKVDQDEHILWVANSRISAHACPLHCLSMVLKNENR